MDRSEVIHKKIDEKDYEDHRNFEIDYSVDYFVS